ncbi:MAG TPA: response regulator [Tenuifilaceae bacterium]|nr:response regulator [Tenuifilaceae bacterium]HPE17250.1 response regulator [Tenuifilaceae bacterium]HPJ44477.1 response regulator [Tenuifilaceae bacterium]HPQ33015.1 response regulator [Tenuifilaceae bacterium]HRX67946.1 response regulator [Tenuifilaceae bacterium]
MTSEKKNILYVDDEKLNLELFRINFRNDYNIFLANSAKEGLEILGSEHINVIISDLKMPDMNGIELIETIKKESPEKICILLTAFMEPEVMLQAINQELVFRYVIKPWTKTNLKNIIELAFEKSNAAAV